MSHVTCVGYVEAESNGILHGQTEWLSFDVFADLGLDQASIDRLLNGHRFARGEVRVGLRLRVNHLIGHSHGARLHAVQNIVSHAVNLVQRDSLLRDGVRDQFQIVLFESLLADQFHIEQFLLDRFV